MSQRNATAGTPAAGGLTEAEADDWVSRKEMAAVAGCSEDSIKRDARHHGLPTATGAKGEVLVRTSDFIRIGHLTAADLPTGLTGPQAAELRRVIADNARLTAQIGELTGRLVEVRSSRDVYVAQLTVKDEQITALTAVLSRSAR